jgi:hypothetical protein
MRRVFRLTPLLAGLALSGCVASIPPVEVTRFHLGQPMPPGGVAVEPLNKGDSDSIEFRTYAAAVARAMGNAGLAANETGNSPLVAAIEVTRATREALRRRSPVTIGVGGGTGGYGSGVGLGASFGIGGSKARETVITRLSVRMMKRSDRSVVWEGRAETQAPANAPSAQPGLAAEKLATALFRDFPGESGKTVIVP